MIAQMIALQQEQKEQHEKINARIEKIERSRHDDNGDHHECNMNIEMQVQNSEASITAVVFELPSLDSVDQQMQATKKVEEIWLASKPKLR